MITHHASRITPMDLSILAFIFSDPLWLVAFALLPPLIVLGLWEGKTVRARRGALGLGRAGSDRWRPRASTVLRAVILSCVLLALAGLQVVQANGPLTVVYLVDVSDSVSPAQRAAAEAYVRAGLAGMPADDRGGVVLFGEHALVERVPGTGRELTRFGSQPPATATDIAEALRLGSALLPAEGRRRLVLLTDGAETTEQALEGARALAAGGIQLDVVPYSREANNEVAVERLSAPSSIPMGQLLALKMSIVSTAAQGAHLSIFEDGVLLEDRDVQLVKGQNVFAASVTPAGQGFHTYRAVIAAVDDRWDANNEAAGFTVVQDAPHVLIVADADEDSEPLRVALEAAHVESTVTEPVAMPTTMEALTEYDSVVLANVSADKIDPNVQKLLQVYVRDLGRGLLMIGGENSFGAGGFFDTPIEAALPVSMDVRTTSRDSDLALAMVVDKSGSMGRCHCGNSGVYRSADVQQTGIAKVDIAKDAIMKAAGTMSPGDSIGVVAFDSLARWVVQLQPVANVPDLADRISGISADGETNIYTGLRAAVDALSSSDAQLKHIILMTDGWSMQGSFDALLDEMRRDNITLSTIGAGGGSTELLQTLAHNGGGRFYNAADVDSVPRLFFKETMLATGSFLIEQPTGPNRLRGSPILNGLEDVTLPQLLGYNNTTAKGTAEVILASPEGEPLLAQWQYGLGRSVAWTSDVKGRWASNWLEMSQFAQFAAQMIGWTLPREESPGLETDVGVGAPASRVTVSSSEPSGAPRNALQTTVRIVAPDGSASEVDLAQEGPGRYTGNLETTQVGPYSLSLQQVDQTGQLVAESNSGFVVPYSAEYAPVVDVAASDRLMAQLAATTGGRVLSINAPADAFASGARSIPARIPAWPLLLVLAVLLFPLDVAVRRVTMTRSDVARFVQSVRSGEFRVRPQPAPVPIIRAPTPPPRITEVGPGARQGPPGAADAPSQSAPTIRGYGLGPQRPVENREADWPASEYESSMRKLKEERERSERPRGD